jgi:formylglycine-generating enzyme required for sulfatase activity
MSALPAVFPHPWASDWGEDEFGLWMGFEVDGLRQGMRWIPPGEFMMGSPEGEPERLDWEGPRHRVVFTGGFWLAETACTQALWQAVMGENPSRFQGADYPEHGEHPVEQVSWDQVQAFLERLSARVPGLEARLPSEAQREYACRAGTESAYFFGDQISEDQACFETDATVPVKLFAPNAWGLYQVHGNVWEWCADCWHRNYRGAPADGAPWLEADEGDCERRVVRGGSWDSTVGGLRSAFRYRWPRDARDGSVGFRLARGHRVSR